MIQITGAARDKIQSLVDMEVARDPALRIALDPDAQSPLARKYAISLVEREDRERTEIAVNVDGIRVFLNLDTSNLLSGAVVDWVEENGASGFRVNEPNARPAPARSTDSSPALTGPLAERIQRLFDETVNPRIAAHGGAVELVDVDDDVIYLRMTGGCQGCAASAATLRLGIERMVHEAIPEVREIRDITDHAAGENPYF